MRFILLVIMLFMASIVQAEQVTHTGADEDDTCMGVMAALVVDTYDTLPDKTADLSKFYKIEDCVCVDRTPEQEERITGDKERWVCTINYYKIPGKW